jgi:hypothetical protein
MAVLDRAEARKHRASKHAGRLHVTPCGLGVYGNGGLSSHQNHCRECLTLDGAYLSESIRRGIFLNLQDCPPTDRLAAYAEWKRQEGARLLSEMDAR